MGGIRQKKNVQNIQIGIQFSSKLYLKEQFVISKKVVKTKFIGQTLLFSKWHQCSIYLYYRYHVIEYLRFFFLDGIFEQSKIWERYRLQTSKSMNFRSHTSRAFFGFMQMVENWLSPIEFTLQNCLSKVGTQQSLISFRFWKVISYIYYAYQKCVINNIAF